MLRSLLTKRKRRNIPKDYAILKVKPLRQEAVAGSNRLIGLATIIQELANNYANGNPIWSYYSRDHQMIYSNSKELRQADMEDVRQWILTLLNLTITPELQISKNQIPVI